MTDNPDLTKKSAAGATSTDTQRDEAAQLGRASSFSLDVERRSIGDSIRGYVNNLRSGEPGALPSVLGLVVLGLIFMQVSDKFLTDYNIGNLPGQGAYIALIAMGLIFVLLLGEIDLSGGTAGGMCAGFTAQALFGNDGLKSSVSGGLYWSLMIAMALMALLGFYLKSITGPIIVILGLIVGLTDLSKHELFAMFFAVAFGCAVGIFIGWLVAKVGIPSFIVTLALFLAFQGVLLFALDSQSKKITDYDLINGLANNNLTPMWSWVFTIVVVLGYAAFTLLKSITAQRKSLAADKISLVLLRAGVIAVVALVVTYFANKNRNPLPFGTLEGLPYAVVIPISLMIVATIALNNTSWGRHLFATGGNAEAARRAGIDVTHIRVTAFTISSGFAALGGLFLASSAGGVVLNLGGGNVLLFSVAAAVIGGTSLFGGRGRPRDAVIGALVIVIIPNGIQLKDNLGPEYQQVITGAVLLIAATVDALSRRRSRSR